MKTNQIRNVLANSGLPMDSAIITENEVEIVIPDFNRPGRCDTNACKEAADLAISGLGWIGRPTVEGTWVLSVPAK